METLKDTAVTLSHPNKPLAIVVTYEGSEFVKLRALALEAIPMLLRPDAYPKVKREQIAQGFRHLLEDDIEIDLSETEYSEEENEGYEPGECLDWPQWEEEE